VIAKSSELNTGLTTLTNGAGELKAGEDALATGAQALANGMEGLQNKSGTLINGVDQLDKGSLELSKGMSKLYKEGIKKIVDMYNDDLKGTIDNVDGMLDAGKGYKTFTKLPSGMDGNVKFIYKTDITQ
jgi:putative membrane protein